MSPFHISVLVVLFGTVAGLTKDYVYVNIAMNKTDAETYCKQNYRGLAVITTQEELERIRNIGGSTHAGWIGLSRSQENRDIWLWEDGTQRLFFNWMTSEPNDAAGIESCALMKPAGWNDVTCVDTYQFYCYYILVLVKEKKTWEEAREYCRMNYTALASPVSATQVQLAEMESSQTQTDSVWTGLRFLDGNWLWVSKEPLGDLVSLPSCPASPYRCGARNIKTHVWENRNCNEKLNFLCYY